MQPTLYLTADGAATYLGGQIHPRTLTRWARENRIPAFAMGDGLRRLWRFRASDLDAWMEERKTACQEVADTSSREVNEATI